MLLKEKEKDFLYGIYQLVMGVENKVEMFHYVSIKKKEDYHMLMYFDPEFVHFLSQTKFVFYFVIIIIFYLKKRKT